MKLFDRLLTAAAGAIVGAAIGTNILGPALALVFPGQYAPRYFPTQQTAYERHIINITSTGCTGDTAQNTALFSSGTCSVRVGALPYNAFVVRVYAQVATACNAGTTCQVALGTSSGGAQLVAAGAGTSILSGAGSGILTFTPAATAGFVSTGNNIASTGADGGFDLYASIVQTGTAATAGTVVIIIEYFGANDGGCPTNVAFPTPANTVGPC